MTSYELPQVVVTMTNWNRRDDMARAIESIQSQDYPNIKILIVDNCSNDGSIQLLEDLEQQGVLSFISCPHSDFSAMDTLNMGFDIAASGAYNAKYIFVMDNDAYLPDAHNISRAVEVMERNPRAFAVSTNVLGSDMKPQMVMVDCEGNILTFQDILTLDVVEWLEFHGAATMLRVDIGKQLDWYDDRFFIHVNEIDLSIRARNAGYPVLFDGQNLTIHSSSVTARPNLRNRIHGFKNLLYVCNTYMKFTTRVPLFALIIIAYTYRLFDTILHEGFKGVPAIPYLTRWVWIALRNGALLFNPWYKRQIADEYVHIWLFHRVWKSFLYGTLRMITKRPLEFGIQ